MASPVVTIHGRYQLGGKPVGQGGMGLVYKAYDTVTRRPVALKTMRGPLNPASLELFAKEWSVLAQISHPNIVDVLDTGDFEQEGEKRPFFVMPFLPGATLEQLLQNASPRLTPERIVGIIGQTCRGLQAAHEHGLIHRDLKPSNIFVLDDDAVKIIDFGIVHLAGADSVKAIKGTLQYMAPEQMELKPCTAASDIYSLAVVSYEALTGRKPFARKTETETAEAIRSHIPPPICELNPGVSQILSRVVHKAMAKDPWHRFSSAREFSESLQKALKGEMIERFDSSRIQPRIDRAKKAHAEGDYQFASEILRELEAEGNIDPEMSLLRIQVDQAVRQKSIRQLIDSARTRLEEDEFPLALQKIQEVLAIDPENPEAAGLRAQIEKQMSQRQMENWFRLVEQHLQNRSFGQARQALEEILKLNANDTRARELLLEVDHREQEIERLRAEKEQLYQAALSCYQKGDISSALTKLERILDVARRSPDSAIPERDAQYETLYNQVRHERDALRNAYAEARRHLTDRNFVKALEMCNEFLKKSPGDPMFQALKLETEEQRRQEQSAFIAEVSRRVDAERDLDRRVNILQEAVDRYPNEPHLEQSLRLVRERRDLVNSIVGKARQYEESGQFTDALSQFEILRNIYAQYPGIEFETERLKRRREEQVHHEAKSRWVEQIDRHITLGDYARARELVRTALVEFPDDRELAGLERFAESALKRAAEAEEWLQKGQKLCFDRQFGEGLEALRKAASLDARNAVIRSALLNALVEQARSVLGQDWRAAEPLIEQALNIDGAHPLARSLQGLVLDYKRQEIVNECVSQARELQAEGDLVGALAKVEACRASYPNELRLVQLSMTLRNLGATLPPTPAPTQPPIPAVAIPGEQQAAAAQSAPEVQKEGSIRTAETEVFTIDRSMVEPAKAPIARPDQPRRARATRNELETRITNLSRLALESAYQLRRRLRDWATHTGRGKNLQWAIVMIASVILVAAVAVRISRRPAQPAPPAPSESAVDVQSNVANATYLVDGKPGGPPPLKLGAGDHMIEASAVGYKSAVQSVRVTAGASKPYIVSFQLEAMPIRLRLFSDLKNAKITLDGQASDLSDGGFANESLPLSTPHTLSLVQAGKEVLSVSFQAEPGGLVTLSDAPVAKDLKVVVVSELGSHARIYASDPSLKGGIKDQPSQPIPGEGLELDVPQGGAEFVLDDGKTPRPVPVEASNEPALAIWLAYDPNYGTLQIEANVPDADLFIDGRKRRQLKAGTNYLGIEPGVHTIRAVKDGYDEAPEQRVDLKKGERVAVPRFDLHLTPKTASLTIEGGTRDTEVLIDGTPAGAVSADGSFKRDDVAPGPHTITLRRNDYEPKQLPKTFTAGQSVRIAGSEAQLTAFGTIDLRVSPTNAVVTYQRTDDPQAHPAENGKPIAMRAGRYTIRASANGYSQRQDTIDVESGRTKPVEFALARIEEPKKAAPPPPARVLSTKDYFRDPNSWKQQDIWWVHRGDEASWFHGTEGVYVIEILKQSSKVTFIKRTKRVQWIIDQKENGDHVDYRLDFASLERQATTGAREGPKAKTAVSGPAKDSYTLQIEISPERILVKDEGGKVLDQYNRPNASEPLGKFGFRGDVALVVRSGPGASSGN